MTQLHLDTVLREHDLPPLWDGLVVVWDGWEALPTVIICPPKPKDPCSACGSLTTPVVNRARVARSTVITRELLAERDAARERLPVTSRGKLKPLALYRLTAFRCPDCRHDLVVDGETGESWDLDVTDYGDTGSKEPS